jgi:hypothetical protein
MLRGKVRSPGHTGVDNLLGVNEVSWLRSEAYSSTCRRLGNSVHVRFARYAKLSVREEVFAELIKDRDSKVPMLDITLVRVHQQAASGK